MIDGRASRGWVVVVVAVLCALVGRSALAQEGHGWFVVDVPVSGGADGVAGGGGASKAAIVHLPPPDQISPRGSVRHVQGLTRSPERLAWSGNNLFILMPGERVAENEVARRVFSISVTPGMMSGWEYRPRDRPETLATLKGEWGARDLEVIGFGAASSAPVVLMQGKRGREGGAYVLLYLTGTDWKRVDLPWDEAGGGVTPSPGPADRCRLITAGESFGILVERIGKGEGNWCVASIREKEAAPEGGAEAAGGKSGPEGKAAAGGAPKAPSETRLALAWTSREVRAEPPVNALGGVEVGSRDSVYCIENQLVRVSFNAAGDARISVLHGSGESEVTTITGLGSNVRTAPVEGKPGFLAFLSAASGASPEAGPRVGLEPKPKEAAPVYRLVEVTPTGRGRVLYDGPVKQGGLVSVREVQVLSVLLVMVMAAVVVFVLRPDKALPANAVALPAGCVPAETGRRVMATLLDVGTAWILASLLIRIDMADFARPDVLLGTARGWQAIGTAAGILIAMATLMEWQFGFTIGKMVLGCRVLSVRESVAPADGEAGPETGKLKALAQNRLPLRAAVWRNIGKWMPWNVVEFLATGHQRAWADRVSGTLVVVLDGSDQEKEEG